ncbi:hypothetical protein AJ87_01170 [Rhizobium yanglingense]|nr:hypothetical protein AJ87_01170 [Rhizobium yanglingense]
MRTRTLPTAGVEFQTETDMLKRVRGAYAFAVLFEDDPSTIMAARNGPPLAVGHGDGEMFLGSDAIALVSFGS